LKYRLKVILINGTFHDNILTEIFINPYKVNLQSLINMANLNIKPLADRVLVEPAAAEEKTASGIYIPDTAKEKPQRGKIVAVGNGKKDEPMTVKVGDTVLYGKYAGTEINIDGKEYLIMRESDIFAII
jgi:chaperonin GroES